MTTRSQVILHKLCMGLVYAAVVAVMTAAAFAGEAYWGFR